MKKYLLSAALCTAFTFNLCGCASVRTNTQQSADTTSEQQTEIINQEKGTAYTEAISFLDENPGFASRSNLRDVMQDSSEDYPELTYTGYSDSEIEDAISQIDWKEQAYNYVIKMESNEVGKTRSKLLLTSVMENNEYTQEEIGYALSKAQINWVDHAVECMNSLKKHNPDITDDELKQAAIDTGFEESEVESAFAKL